MEDDMNYYDFLKMVRGTKKRVEFIELNNKLNHNEEFKILSRSEQFSIKAELYQWFKLSGYKDSKNFSFLIATKPIQMIN